MATATDKAYEKIGDLILSGHFEPGDHLSEEELSRITGVSRTPVRDALRRLETEYFVTIRPNQGAEVAVWDARDIQDLFHMRAMLEGMAASRAAERGSAKNIAKMQAHVDAIAIAIESKPKPDVAKFLSENRNFHRALLEAAQSPRLNAAISNLIAPAIVARTAQTFSKEDLIRSNTHHQELVDAIRVGDRDFADSMMQTHIRTAAKSYRKVFD